MQNQNICFFFFFFKKRLGRMKIPERFGWSGGLLVTQWRVTCQSSCALVLPLSQRLARMKVDAVIPMSFNILS